jgi:hypothetical protein
LQLQLHLCSSGGLNTIFGSTSSSISNILTSQKEDIAAETGPDATYSSLHGIAKLLHSKLGNSISFRILSVLFYILVIFEIKRLLIDDQHQRFSFNCDRLIERYSYLVTLIKGLHEYFFLLVALTCH